MNKNAQFTSAMTGDVAGCLATNVIPTFNEDGTQARQDAYLLVADKAISLTEKMISENKDPELKPQLEFFLNLLNESGRKICKRPVMVSNYGGTTGGRAEIVYDMLRELGCDRVWINKKNAALFGKILGDSIFGVLNGGKAFETYIHNMNNVITKRDCAITWETSDGFHVVHKKNKELKEKRVKVALPGSRKDTVISLKKYSDSVNPAKMKSAISPNYVHSLDAELLRRVSRRMKKAGIKYSDWIHDSFGAHPNNVDFMLEVTKDEFKKLVLRNPLLELDKQLRIQAGTDKASLKKLAEIKVPKFENITELIEQVMVSNWFFS